MGLEIVATGTHSGARPATLSGQRGRSGALGTMEGRRLSMTESDVPAPAGDRVEVLDWCRENDLEYRPRLRSCAAWRMITGQGRRTARPRRTTVRLSRGSYGSTQESDRPLLRRPINSRNVRPPCGQGKANPSRSVAGSRMIRSVDETLVNGQHGDCLRAVVDSRRSRRRRQPPFGRDDGPRNSGHRDSLRDAAGHPFGLRVGGPAGEPAGAWVALRQR